MKKLLILISVLLLTACIPEENEIVINTTLNPGFDILTVGNEHVDTGCVLTIDDTVFNMEVITNTVNINELGEYLIRYFYRVDEISYNCERHIKVIDDVFPVVSLNSGIDTMKIGEEHIDLGITYSDNFDEELEVIVTSNVDINTVGRYIITYTVTDDSMNITEVIRVVNIIE